MQGKLDQLQLDRGRTVVDKKANNTKLAKKKESVLSELEKLRTLNRAHRKLMVEIWSHLTTLARVSMSCTKPPKNLLCCVFSPPPYPRNIARAAGRSSPTWPTSPWTSGLHKLTEQVRRRDKDLHSSNPGTDRYTPQQNFTSQMGTITIHFVSLSSLHPLLLPSIPSLCFSVSPSSPFLSLSTPLLPSQPQTCL